MREQARRWGWSLSGGAGIWVQGHWRRLSWDRRRQIKSVVESAAWIWAITLLAVVILNALGFTAPGWLILATGVPALVLMTVILVGTPLAFVHMWWTSDGRKDFWRRWKAQDGR